MEYERNCAWCRKNFTAKRKDNIFCSDKCKGQHFRITNGFTLVDPFLPEDLVNKNYRNKTNVCAIFFMWFKQDGKRFADVYESNDCYSPKMEKKMLKYKNTTVNKE
jgi:hypothetical protein